MALREKTGMISLANAKDGHDEDVDLGVAEDPEEVHPQHGRAAGLGVEEVRAEIAIEQQHDLGGGQRADREENHAGHHQIEPDQAAACGSASCRGSACR